jgi:HD-like signal output (HDOD) protein
MVIDRKELLAKLHQLPSLPLVLQELVASFSDANMDTVLLAHRIEHDQGLSAKVLRMANSSFYGLPRKVGSIQDAVTVLGFDTVRSLVLSAGIIRHIPSSSGGSFDRQAYWSRCYRIATISQSLSKTIQQGQNFAFTTGMFCEIGQLALDLCIPQQFAELLRQQANSQSSLVELEQSELGFDHFELGADIVRMWNFPQEIELIIRHWNNPELQTTCDPLACVAHIAATLENGVMNDEVIAELSRTWCARIQMPWEEIKANLPLAEHHEGFCQEDHEHLTDH